MRITHEFQFSAGVAEVLAVLADPEYVRQKIAISGAQAISAEVVSDELPGFAVSTKRRVKISDLPKPAQAFIGSDLEIRQVDVWLEEGPDNCTGTVALEVVGVPARVTGGMELRATSGGCAFALNAEIKHTISSLSFLVATVESTLRKKIIDTLQAELELVTSWLPK